MAKNVDFDWYLSDWMASTEMSQADLCRATGFSKAKLSELTNGVSRYNRDVVNALSGALNIRPYELLMHPTDANAIRQLRETAFKIVAENQPDSAGDSEKTEHVRKNRKKIA